jgi:iron complex transport system substrate-binding protein
MSNIPAALLLCLLAVTTAHASERPSRVVSINLCTDQLLLMLAEPNQIASVSYLSRDPHSSFMAREAAHHPVNQGKIEQLLTIDPDLVLAYEYSPPPLLQLLRRLGYRVVVLPMATGIDDIRRNIRQLAGVLGVRARGEALITRMDQRLERTTRKQRGKRPLALFYQPRGYTSGRNTLQDATLTLTGWRNLAAERGIIGYSTIDLESLLLARPDQLFTSSYAPGTRSLAQGLLQHPALRQVTGGRPVIDIDYRYWICGGPMIADAVEALAAAHPE